MADLLGAYLARLTLAGFRPATIDARRTCLRAFSATADLLTATRGDCEAFLARPLALASRRSNRDHLRSFYRYALEEGLRVDDPTERIPAVRVPRGSPRPIAGADLHRALALADRRMRAWLLLMSLAGLRCIEVAALRPDDLRHSTTGPLLYLRETKGGGTATLPAHPAIVTALATLPIIDGLWWSVKRSTVSQDVSAYLHGLGIEASGHSLRHFAGTAFFEASGHDLLTTAALLRHSNVTTTMIYAQLSPTRPAEVVGLVPYPAA